MLLSEQLSHLSQIIRGSLRQRRDQRTLLDLRHKPSSLSLTASLAQLVALLLDLLGPVK